MLHTAKPYSHRYQLFDSQPCWWMLAGVVDYKLCDRKLDCEHCPFDLGLHGASESGARSTDESLDFNFDESLFYHQAHVWARVEDCGNVRIGLDDFGQKLLGRAYAVSLPKKGCLVEGDRYSWSVTHKVGETALVVPLNGEIIDVNAKLGLYPSLLNREPFGSGWAFMLKPADLETGLGNLFYGATARGWHLEQCETLYARASELSGSQLPDGGRLRKDFLSELSADQVLDLIASFLSGPRDETNRRQTLCDLKLKRR